MRKKVNIKIKRLGVNITTYLFIDSVGIEYLMPIKENENFSLTDFDELIELGFFLNENEYLSIYFPYDNTEENYRADFSNCDGATLFDTENDKIIEEIESDEIEIRISNHNKKMPTR